MGRERQEELQDNMMEKIQLGFSQHMRSSYLTSSSWSPAFICEHIQWYCTPRHSPEHAQCDCPSDKCGIVPTQEGTDLYKNRSYGK